MKSVKSLVASLLICILILGCSTKATEDAVDESVEETVDAVYEDEVESEYEASEEILSEDGQAVESEGEEIVEVSSLGEEGNDYYTDPDGKVVYTFLMEEDRPVFNDGTLAEYLKKHLVYPLESKENNSEGTVVVDFVVEEDGSIGETKVAKALDDELLNAEALKIVEAMPDWVPGEKDGVPVAYKYSLPIHFVLE